MPAWHSTLPVTQTYLSCRTSPPRRRLAPCRGCGAADSTPGCPAPPNPAASCAHAEKLRLGCHNMEAVRCAVGMCRKMFSAERACSNGIGAGCRCTHCSDASAESSRVCCCGCGLPMRPGNPFLLRPLHVLPLSRPGPSADHWPRQNMTPLHGPGMAQLTTEGGACRPQAAWLQHM